ncbi:MarR family transcriptional regulator [Sphingomonas sp. GV3]|uniref:MarR family transcriptional regulator n=1 Tax=Sphingomonas sp. GV3 TaxID=3040671 RepID=UPI00280C3756|nr:MarR family transcriptional regulator [Sphingomonas sp. GV3]
MADPVAARSFHRPNNMVELLDLARQTQAVRAKMAKLLPRDIFRDSAWDMILELFVAAREQRSVCVKQLVLVSGETATSALRRIGRLEEAGLLRRRTDHCDHRRIMVELAPKGDEAMCAMLHNLFLEPAPAAGEVVSHRSFNPSSVPGLRKN